MTAGQSLRVVLLTPPGRGAVATLRAEGPGTCARVDSLFEAVSHSCVAGLSCDRLACGRFRLGEGVYDEVIVRRVAEETVDIHCHGGPAVVERLIQALIAEGGERISPESWLQTSCSSRIAASAHSALANATTLRGAAILLDQCQGALDRTIQEIIAWLDRGEVQPAAKAIQSLLAVAPCGCHLARPWRVVLAGRPNVGKSSLINALLGYRRSIVHQTPGTTRDLVTARTALDGWPVELCDTAGLRAAEQEIERQGIGLAQRRLESASLVLLVFDATIPWSEADIELVDRFPEALLVFNKLDLVREPSEGRPAGQWVSALGAQGIDELIARISARLVPCPPQPGQAVPFLEPQASALLAAAGAIESGDLRGASAQLAGLVSFQ